MSTQTTFLFLLLFASPSIQYARIFGRNSIANFFEDQTANMNDFLLEHKRKVENLISSSYQNAVKMKKSVNEYMESQQKQITEDVHRYVDLVKESRRKMTDSFSFIPESVTEDEKIENPDLVLSVPAIIQRNGYNCETHSVVSEGYVLNLHRIPHSINSNEVSKKTVLLHHGLFASSADWILNGPGKALAYVLSEAGYDVWMANVRGNKYSREHLSLKSDSKAYWNFSWHDIAEQDVPAIIDYIKKVKGQDSKIIYIGHSMGTTILFAMLALRPEYNDILTAGVALAPVVFMSDVKSPIKALSSIASNVAYMEMVYGSYEFIPKQSALGRIASSCDVDDIDSKICKNVVFSICGYNEKQFNKTLLPLFLSHLGTGTSWKTVVHFAQIMGAGGKFQKFDYGPNYNYNQYGIYTPPEYDLESITLPIKLFWARNDLLSGEEDVMMLYYRLNDDTELHMVPDPDFNHVDYLWAIDAPTLLNNKLLQVLEKSFSK